MYRSSTSARSRMPQIFDRLIWADERYAAAPRFHTTALLALKRLNILRAHLEVFRCNLGQFELMRLK